MYRNALRLLTGATALVILLGGARPASAGSIQITGNDQFVMNWLYDATTPDLAATARFTITNFTHSGFDLSIDLIGHLTAPTPDIEARLISFGFGLSPDYTSVTNAVDGSVFKWGFSGMPGFGSVDVCGYAGQNCNGGGNAGLNPGEWQVGTMTIHFNGDFSSGVTFSPLVARIQTNLGSFTFDTGCIAGVDVGCDPTQPFDPTTPVPEPASLALLGLGLLGLAAKLRRKKA